MSMRSRPGCGGVLERIVVGGPDAGFDLADFLADGDHRRDEAVQFGLGFRIPVGSTMIVPATGKLTVGAWKP